MTWSESKRGNGAVEMDSDRIIRVGIVETRGCGLREKIFCDGKIVDGCAD